MTKDQSNLFVERLWSIVKQHGDHPAICVDGAVACTYAELWQWSGQIANALQQQGIAAGSTVALFLPKSAGYVAALLGVWRCRAAWVPIEPTLPQNRIKFLIEDSRTDLIIHDGCIDELNVASDFLDICMVSEKDFSSDNGNITPSFQNFHASDLAYVIYTSGTTGQPNAGCDMSCKQFSHARTDHN